MLPNSIILLSLCFVAICAIFKEASLRRNSAAWGNRDSFILACITQSTLLVFITDGLSVFHLLQRTYLFVGWVSVLVISFLIFAYLRVSRVGLNTSLIDLRDWKLPRLELTPVLAVFLALISFQLVTLAMIAYVYPPNNWDSLTYHMSRVVHWQQNQSVALYATNIVRQLQSQPFAEYALVNLQIMLKNDAYANFVQFFAFFVSFIGVTNITKKMGGTRDQQIMAGMLSISLPMAILQSTSTQSDLVVSQWLICFVVMGFGLMREPENYLWVLGAGLALGLACLTKATAFIFALPFCIWFGTSIVKKSLKNITAGLVIGILVLLLNSAFLIRNYQLFSNPLGTSVMFQTTNELHSLGGLASNVIRNTALNFTEKDNVIYQSTLGWLQILHQFTGFPDSDPRISLHDTDIFKGLGSDLAHHEDFAGNPIQAVLIFLTILVLVINYRKSKINTGVILYGFCLIVGFLSFSYYLKFQEWGNRLLLPMFLLWSPVIILALFARYERVLKFLIVGVLLFSFTFTFGNSIRGINYEALPTVKEREKSYFANNQALYPIYAELSDKIIKSDCHALGLSLGENTWEYPFWVLLANRKWQGRIEHVNIGNPSSTLQDKNFVPCVVISDNSNGKEKYSYYDWTVEFIAPKSP